MDRFCIKSMPSEIILPLPHLAYQQMHSNRVGNIGGYRMLFPFFNDRESSVKGHNRGGGCDSNNIKLAATALYSQVLELSTIEPLLLS